MATRRIAPSSRSAPKTAIRARHAALLAHALKDLSPEDKVEIALGIKDGERKIDAAFAQAVNGGRDGVMLGDSAFFNGDWLRRAAAAKAGIYGHDAAEAIYLHPCVLHDVP